METNFISPVECPKCHKLGEARDIHVHGKCWNCMLEAMRPTTNENYTKTLRLFNCPACDVQLKIADDLITNADGSEMTVTAGCSRCKGRFRLTIKKERQNG